MRWSPPVQKAHLPWLPGALGPGAVAGEEHDADVGRAAGVVEHAVELVDGVRPERVQHLGSVERHAHAAQADGSVVGDVGEVLEAGHLLPGVGVEGLADTGDRAHGRKAIRGEGVDNPAAVSAASCHARPRGWAGGLAGQGGGRGRGWRGPEVPAARALRGCRGVLPGGALRRAGCRGRRRVGAARGRPPGRRHLGRPHRRPGGRRRAASGVRQRVRVRRAGAGGPGVAACDLPRRLRRPSRRRTSGSSPGSPASSAVPRRSRPSAWTPWSRRS